MKKIKKNLGQQKNGIPQQHYDADKDLVATTGASYCVKYLGYEEVKEARGVKVCSAAVAKLIKDKKNKKKMSLMISMDGVRVVDDVSRVLVLDQPIEKISFCAPDSLNPKLFSYIARDGPCRRWLCYGFYACDVPGERLSHALGCAFTACLQRKQKAANKDSTEGKDSPGSKSSPATKQPSDTQPSLPVAKQPITVPKQPVIKQSSNPSLTVHANTISTPRRTSQPAIRTNHSAGSVKRQPPKEITVPLPAMADRDRSATTIGMSTPPSVTVMHERGKEENDEEGGFTADLADILLFDPNEMTSQHEQRRRAATERTPTHNLLDEFDPLHPIFKTMQFDDDFKPPELDDSNDQQGVTMASSHFHGNMASTFTQFSNTNPFASQPGPSLDDFDSFAANRIGQR